MAEYINRAAAIAIADYAADEHPYKEQGKPETYSQYNEGWNDACDYIRGKLESEKAADVAPVVRCKDCIFYKETRYPSGNVYFACHKFLTKMTKTDDFCSYGERCDNG